MCCSIAREHGDFAHINSAVGLYGPPLSIYTACGANLGSKRFEGRAHMGHRGAVWIGYLKTIAEKQDLREQKYVLTNRADFTFKR